VLTVCLPLLGAFAKFPKAIIIFHLSFRPHGTTRLPVDGFPQNLIFENFSKVSRENSSFVEIDKE
jgi:hypothetical protein